MTVIIKAKQLGSDAVVEIECASREQWEALNPRSQHEAVQAAAAAGSFATPARKDTRSVLDEQTAKARDTFSAPHNAGAATQTDGDLTMNDNPTEKLDTLTADYAKANNVDRPTARVAVMKTADGKRLYAESVGRARVEAPVVQRAAKAAATASAAEKQAELEALAKAKGMRLSDFAMTPEGKRLYAEAIRASRGGV